jgi:hypothetical protein
MTLFEDYTHYRDVIAEHRNINFLILRAPDYGVKIKPIKARHESHENPGSEKPLEEVDLLDIKKLPVIYKSSETQLFIGLGIIHCYIDRNELDKLIGKF